jgi:hypothetical protein
MASCVAIYWPPNEQWVNCLPYASNLCPHSHVKRLNDEGLIKPKQKHKVKVEIKCVMWNKWIDGLATNHSPAPLLEQNWMQTLNTKEMESSSKIDLRDVSWWKSIKDAYRHGVLVTTRLSIEGCISLVIEGRPSRTTCRQKWSRWGPPLTWETYFSKIGLLKIWNLEHKYKATKA